MFTKKDLRNGDFVVRSRTEIGVVIREINRIVYQDGQYSTLDDLDDDLTFASGAKVLKIYRPNLDGFGGCFNMYEKGELVYDRGRDTIKEMTVEEIEKELGYKIKVVTKD